MSKKDAFNLVKLCITNYNPADFAYSIKKIIPENIDERGELACLWLAQGPLRRVIERSLKDFNISSLKWMEKFVDTLKQTDQASKIPKLIKSGTITIPSENKRVEIAKLLAKEDSEELLIHIDAFKFDKEILLEVIDSIFEDQGVSLSTLSLLLRSKHQFPTSEISTMVTHWGIDLDNLHGKLKQENLLGNFKALEKLAKLYKKFGNSINAKSIDQVADMWKNECGDTSFESLFPMTGSNDKELQATKLRWLIQLICDSKLMKISSEESQKNIPLYQALLNLRDHEARKIITKRFLANTYGSKRELNFERWQEIRDALGKLGPKKIGALIPSCIASPYLKETFLKSFTQKVKSKNATLKPHVLKLATTLNSLTRCSNLNDKRKGFWIQKIYECKTYDEKVSMSHALLTLIGFGLESKLETLSTKIECEKLIEVKFKQLFNLESFENFYPKYLKTIGSYRFPETITTYASNIKKLSPSDQETLFPLLQNFVKTVLEETFLNDRMLADNNPQLAEIRTIDPIFFQKWSQKHELIPATELLPKIINQKEKSLQFDLKVFLKQQLFTDKHLSCNPEEELPNLKNELEGTPGKLIGSPYLKIEDAIIKCLKKGAKKKQVQTLFQNLVKIIPKNTEFMRAIEEKLNEAKIITSANKLNHWKVGIPSNPWDYLRLGSDIQGSCQRVDGSANLNKCLLSYLLDGKNLPIVVKEKGKIIGRCILRALLVDGKPVIFRERLYVNNQNPKVELLLLKYSQQFAKQMDKPLITTDLSNDEKGKKSKNPAVSLGGRAKYEYVDALGNRESGNLNKFAIHKYYEIIPK